MVGRFIGGFTWGLYKHVSMVFELEDGTLKGFQSNSKHGVHFFSVRSLWDGGAGDEVDVFLVPCTAAQARRMLLAAHSVDGAGYDFTGIWGFVRRAKRENPDKWFCSEVASWVCAQGEVLLQRLPFFKQSPVLVCASVILDRVYRRS
jgi:hypothetical protein